MTPEQWVTTISNPPHDKPLLIFDGDCSFCRRWVIRLQKWVGEKIDYQPFQKVREQYSEIPSKQFQKSVHYLETDGSVHFGAKAIFLPLRLATGMAWFWFLYQWLPGFASISEWGYRVVAENRLFFDKLMTWLIGRSDEPATYHLSRWIFLKAIGVVYFMAFCSLWVQIDGLIGSDGLLPVSEYLNQIAKRYEGLEYYLVPSLTWVNSSDLMLHGLCWLGMILSVLLIVGLAPALLLAILWILYLSLVSVGQVFLSYQWDSLLLEAGFLAIFFAPWRWWPKVKSEPAPSRIILVLFWFLLFRLMFSSGMVKLLSGDEAWLNMTALLYHYETQPLTNWVAWYVHQMPMWFHKFSCLMMFLIELLVPFLIFTPRRPRFLACILLISLQILILITGNYGFFNYLSIALCLLLIDDVYWRQLLPQRWRTGTYTLFQNPMECFPKRYLNRGVGFCVLMLGVFYLYLLCFRGGYFVQPMIDVIRIIQPFHIVNNYGLFAVMTKERPEIIIQGSMDGEEWKSYEFHYKVGDPSRAPGFAAPHMPRMDWQMWFAALENYQQNRWLIKLQEKILLGNQTVLEHFQHNPFPDNPPLFIRAVVYDYKFTNFEERKESGNWWKRSFEGSYNPALRLKGYKG